MKKRFLCAAFAVLLLCLPLSGCVLAPAISAAAAPGEVEEYQIGTIENNTYNNEFFDIGCDLDDTWIILNEEELAELSGITFDMMEEGGLGNSDRLAMENGSYVFDFFARKEDYSAAINTSVANIGILYGTALTEEGYIDATTEQIVKSLEATGYENVTSEKTTIMFAGAEHTALTVYGESAGMPIYQTLVAIRKSIYVGTVAFTTANEDTTGNLITLFYALD